VAAYSVEISSEPFVTQIFRKDLESGDVVQLTRNGNNGWPRWSPDGSKILFVSWTQATSYDIYLMDRDGGNQQPLVAGSASESMAAWSPDGTRIAFVSNRDGGDEIYAVNADDGEITKLTDLSFAVLPSWSTDGTRLAFISNTGVSGRSQVFVMNADGTDVKQMTKFDLDHFDGDPVWCPDDACIVFTRFVEGVPKLMRVDLAGGETSVLLGDIFEPDLPEVRLARSYNREYMTFSVGGAFYAMDINSGKIFPLNVQGLDLSLYP
jgi:Tol biopolymer transport system component